MNFWNSLLNAVFLVGLCVGAYFYFTLPKDYGPPPNDAWFQSAVVSQSEPVLVKFGADWCGPCRMMEPVLDQFAAHIDGRVGVVRVDVDQHSNLAQHYGVSAIPHLFLFRHGRVVADRVGSADEEQLRTWVAAHAQE